MTETEARIRAKIPGPDTGIEVKKTFCDICAPGCHCGLDAYVRDGRLLKVEGTAGHPMNDGVLCTRGACTRQYIYRADRLTQPLKRVGPKGSGEFEPIGWDEAYDLIAEKLNGTKAAFGANAVAFYSGYEKWYRFMLQRFAHAFGSVNYGTESSTCFTANKMAWMTMTGRPAGMDLANAKLYLAWASGSPWSRWKSAGGLEAFRRRGGTIILVDPRVTPISQRYADLHLRVRPGTDGLLAACLAGELIRRGLYDADYVEKYVSGFEEYKNYVNSITPEETARITGVPAAQIARAAELIGTIRPMCVDSGPGSLIHQTNGFQTARAVFALSALTGNYDRAGGNFPAETGFCEMPSGWQAEDERFATENAPADYASRVGAGRFPVWGKLIPQAQYTDLARQILEGTPYPVKSLMAFGMNYRMFPDSGTMKKALLSLDFFADVDLFLTDSARLADLVLPCVSSLEREEFKAYPGGFAAWYSPVLPPYGESRSDARILRELTVRLGLEDEYLRGGYRKCVENALRDTGLDLDELAKSPLPVRVPPELMTKREPLGYVNSGCRTKSGKLELWSALVEACGNGLDPLPRWVPPAAQPDGEYPFLLMTGVRLPNAIHSRLHSVPWARALRPEAAADLSPEDAAALSVEAGEPITIRTETGAVTVAANPTAAVAPGQIYLYHGYPEADACSLLHGARLDPYSGFPGYLSVKCAVTKEGGAAR